MLCGMAATQLHEHDALDDPRDARIAALEAIVRAQDDELRVLRAPRPPSGWCNVKTARELAHVAGSTIYDRCRRGVIRSIKLRSRIWVDPASL
jgi:hypothetical protein